MKCRYCGLKFGDNVTALIFHEAICFDVKVDTSAQAEQPKPISDHADAAKDSLLRIVRLLEAGNSPEDLGPQVILIGRMMARKT